MRFTKLGDLRDFSRTASFPTENKDNSTSLFSEVLDSVREHYWIWMDFKLVLLMY